MIKIDFLTIFPELVRPYMEGSIMKRACDAGVASFGYTDIRDFAEDKHHRVDDTPYGGGAGMVMQVAPIHRAVVQVVENSDIQRDRRIILLSAKGKRFTQSDAQRLKNYKHVIFICGRYEGVDERVAEHIADEELSIGDYVLTGGELGAMVIADSIVRLLPGVLGNAESIIHESHATEGYCEHPQYTKPEDFNGWHVPDVLLSGNHQLIEKWRSEHSKKTDNV
ncbi:MAG: tRNA (guanosine(37)-N1)-methyltransferase TrmD [Parcubacteria group bacterium]|jgi:tRNA (guanine37-N1)-methyltransferase